MRFLRLIILSLFTLSLSQTSLSVTRKNLKDFYLTAKCWSRLSDFKDPKSIKDEIKKKLHIDLESTDVLVAVDISMIGPKLSKLKSGRSNIDNTEGVLNFIPKWLPIKYFFNENFFGEIELKQHMMNPKTPMLMSSDDIVQTNIVLHHTRKLVDRVEWNIRFTLAHQDYIDRWISQYNDVIKSVLVHENYVTKHYKFVESKELEQEYKNYRRRTQSGISKLFKKF